MYNDFERHQRGDHAKWVITGIAFVLVFIMIIGLCMQIFMPAGKRPADWFNKDTETQVEEQNEQGGMELEPVEESGIRLMAYAIPRASFSAYGIEPQAETAQTVTATLVPDNVLSKNVVWSLDWKNPNDQWVAEGKHIEDYVSISSNGLTCTVSCLQPFGETIILTCASKYNPAIKATCNVEYIRKISYITFSSTVDGNKLMLNSGGSNERVRFRGPMLGETFLNGTTLNVTESSVKAASNFVFTPSYAKPFTKEDAIVKYEMEIRLDPTLIANLFEECSDLLDSSVYSTYIVDSSDTNASFAPFASLFYSTRNYEGPFSCFNNLQDYVTLNNLMYYWGNGGAHFICEIRATTASGAQYSSGEIPVAIDMEYLDLGPQNINLNNTTINF